MSIKINVSNGDGEYNSNPLDEEFEGLKSDIELQANKLFLLIQNSEMSAETKESFLDLLPVFSLEQIEKLINILEAKYLDEQTSEIDLQFQNDLKSVIDDYKANDQKEKEIFVKQIKVISQSL